MLTLITFIIYVHCKLTSSSRNSWYIDTRLVLWFPPEHVVFYKKNPNFFINFSNFFKNFSSMTQHISLTVLQKKSNLQMLYSSMMCFSGNMTRALRPCRVQLSVQLFRITILIRKQGPVVQLVAGDCTSIERNERSRIGGIICRKSGFSAFFLYFWETAHPSKRNARFISLYLRQPGIKHQVQHTVNHSWALQASANRKWQGYCITL